MSFEASSMGMIHVLFLAFAASVERASSSRVYFVAFDLDVVGFILYVNFIT